MAANKVVVAADKFGFLDKRQKPATTEDETVQTAPSRSKAKESAAAKAVAKSKDPSMKGYTLILKKKTHIKANSILKILDTEGDLSDLTERLLAEWVTKHEHVH